jgi:hypothetical protein
VRSYSLAEDETSEATHSECVQYRYVGIADWNLKTWLYFRIAVAMGVFGYLC